MPVAVPYFRDVDACLKGLRRCRETDSIGDARARTFGSFACSSATSAGANSPDTVWRIDGRTDAAASTRKTDGLGILQTASAESSLADIASNFPLPWSVYIRLVSVKNLHARGCYETEAPRGGWSIRQLDRQIDSQAYESTALSKDKAPNLSRNQLEKGHKAVWGSVQAAIRP